MSDKSKVDLKLLEARTFAMWTLIQALLESIPESDRDSVGARAVEIGEEAKRIADK